MVVHEMQSNKDISLDASNELFLILSVSFIEMECFLNIERHFCLKVYGQFSYRNSWKQPQHNLSKYVLKYMIFTRIIKVIKVNDGRA